MQMQLRVRVGIVVHSAAEPKRPPLQIIIVPNLVLLVSHKILYVDMVHAIESSNTPRKEILLYQK